MENIRLENSLSRRNFLKGVVAGAAALGIPPRLRASPLYRKRLPRRAQPLLS